VTDWVPKIGISGTSKKQKFLVPDPTLNSKENGEKKDIKRERLFSNQDRKGFFVFSSTCSA
jgi:hypothetical protein